ncbi:MAG: pantetheine-phosphate adenylyltransferase [Myxococcales bacterium]|nr:pantetheine-phosphate adenylyltransferase [Myxococcales bacterium]
MARVAVYPGSFDPLTNGHLDIIERSLEIFDKLVVAVAHNQRKQPLFSLQERIDIVRAVTDPSRVEVDTIEGLLVDYARAKGAKAVVRGLRAVADFEYEFQMTLMNRRLAPDVETVFLMTRDDHSFVSSSLVKEVASFGGKVDEFVPPLVAERLKQRIAERAAQRSGGTSP